MNGRVSWVFVVGASLALAGCSGGQSKSVGPEGPPASVVVGEDALSGGFILGTVVSDELAPIQGATAGLQGIDQTVATDAAGRFEFQNVPPGDYTLFVAKLGYEAAPKKVQVVEGEKLELMITLKTLAIVEDFIDIIEFKLRMACGFGLVGVTSTGGCPAAATGDHKVVADHSVTPDVQSAQSELIWVQNSALSSKEMRLDMGKDESGGSLPTFKYRYGSATGKSPVVVRADAEFDGLSDLEPDKYNIRHRVWVPFRSADPPVVIVVLQQPMAVWSSMAYGAPLPEGFSALPDS